MTRSATSAASRQLLGEAAQRYADWIAGEYSSSSTDALTRAVREHALVDPSGGPLKLVLRPRFILEADYEALVTVAATLSRALFAAVHVVRRDERLRRRLAYPEYLEDVLALDDGRAGWPTIGRFDALIDASQRPHFIEYNSEPKGMNEYFELGDAFERLSIAAAFRERFPFRSLSLFNLTTEALTRWCAKAQGNGASTVGVVSTGPALAQDPSFRHMAYAAARGRDIVVARAEEYEWNGTRLYLAEQPIDHLVFVDWTEIFARRAEAEGLFSAIQAGAVHVLNGVSLGVLCSYKHTLELLTDEQYELPLDPDLRAVVRAHVPWTRALRPTKTTLDGRSIDLLAYVDQHKDEFVLKPGGGSGGVGVSIGGRCTSSEWAQALAQAIGTHVVQRYEKPQAEVYPVLEGDAVAFRQLEADCCPFVWNGERGEACSVRASGTGVFNRGRGAM